MENFMNKHEPLKGKYREKMLQTVRLILNVPYIDTFVQEVSKHDLTVDEINHIIFKHMLDLIREFHLEYDDYKNYIRLWEEEMKENERLRKEMWD